MAGLGHGPVGAGGLGENAGRVTFVDGTERRRLAPVPQAEPGEPADQKEPVPDTGSGRSRKGG